jgi:hypothetical protein
MLVGIPAQKWVMLVRIPEKNWVMLARISPLLVGHAGENTWVMLVGNDTHIIPSSAPGLPLQFKVDPELQS